MKKMLPVLLLALSFQLSAFSCFGADKGLVGSWKFDEGKGSVAKDSAGKNDGDIQGEPEWVDGKSGKALLFDGADQTVLINNAESLNSADMTIMMWARSEENRIQGLADKSSPADSWRLFMNDPSSGTIEFDALSDQFNCPSKGKAAVGKWCHVAATFESVKKTMKIYIDGKLSGTFANAESAGNEYEGNIQIASPENNRFHGAIDEVKMYNRALTADEIAAEAGVATAK